MDSITAILRDLIIHTIKILMVHAVKLLSRAKKKSQENLNSVRV